MMKHSHGVAKATPVFGFFTLFLAACSNGGGGSTPPPAPPPPPPPSGPTWTQGVFEAASTFKDRCQVVRTGVDIEGNAFPDMAGSTLEENFWLRSWTHETYLWNDEVVDQNPRNFNNRLDYFAVLKTEEITPSGKPKDEFHFTQPTDEFLEARNSTPSATYGASLVAFSTTPPRDFRIRFTEPNSPASTVVMGLPNFVRGARILEVDGVDLVNAGTQTEIDMLNAGLFPATAGETHTFEVQDPGAATSRMVTMTSVDLARKPVNRIETINTATGPVGYMLLNTFSPFASEKDIADAITALKADGVNDLIIDLRYNGGGLLAVAAQLGFQVAGAARTNGKIFETLRFNADAMGVDPVTGATNSDIPFYSEGLGFSLAEGTPLESLNLPRVFILSTDNTCSASESVVNSLRGIDVEVILLGSKTCGKPFGFYPTDNCGETYFTVQFQGINDKGFGDYADGFAPMNSSDAFAIKAPGCEVADDLENELGDEMEAMLAAALQYRDSGTCPTPPPSPKPGGVAKTADGFKTPIEIMPQRDVFETNRDMTLPKE